jgi:hypothetical protein
MPAPGQFLESGMESSEEPTRHQIYRALVERASWRPSWCGTRPITSSARPSVLTVLRLMIQRYADGTKKFFSGPIALAKDLMRF